MSDEVSSCIVLPFWSWLELKSTARKIVFTLSRTHLKSQKNRFQRGGRHFAIFQLQFKAEKARSKLAGSVRLVKICRANHCYSGSPRHSPSDSTSRMSCIRPSDAMVIYIFQMRIMLQMHNSMVESRGCYGVHHLLVRAVLCCPASMRRMSLTPGASSLKLSFAPPWPSAFLASILSTAALTRSTKSSAS